MEASSYQKFKCPKCGHEVKKEDKHCSNCGGELTLKTAIQPMTSVNVEIKNICPKCGKEFTKGEKFCPKDKGKIEEKRIETPVFYR